MKKYLYLQKQSFVRNWVEGGQVPLRLASRFVSDIRNGTQTPDENLVYQSNVDMDSLPFLQMNEFVSLTMVGCSMNGRSIPNILDAHRYQQDGLILCFSNHLDRKTAEDLDKVACVEIQNIEGLKEHLDEQLDVVGTMEPCRYTDSHQHNHFLKSDKDEWQDEYRIFWPIVLNEVWVAIPPGTGVEKVFAPTLVRNILIRIHQFL